METTANFDSNYFAKLMEDANAQGIDAGIMDNAKEALSSANKGVLKKLMNSEPKDFYKNLINAFGSAMLNARTVSKKTEVFKAKEEVVGEMKDNPTAAFASWIFRAMKAVAAFLLGVAKFAWDVVLITGSFTGRFAWRLVKNTAKAVATTAVETKNDVVFAGRAVGSSFKENVLSTMPDPARDVTVEIVEEVPVVEAEVVTPAEEETAEVENVNVEITNEEGQVK